MATVLLRDYIVKGLGAFLVDRETSEFASPSAAFSLLDSRTGWPFIR